MPNGVSDGAVVIDTGLDNRGFMRDAAKFKRAIRTLLQAVEKTGQQMGKSGNAYGQALRNQARGARTLNKEIETTSARYAEVVREMNELQKTGGSQSRYDELSKEAKSLSARLGELRNQKDALGGVQSGFDNVASSAASAARSVARIAGGTALSFLKKLASGAKNAAIQLAKLAGRAVVNGVKRLAQYASGAAKSLFGLGRGARQSGQGFQMSLKNVLRYGLGIRSLFVLFNRLRSAIKEGFETLANYDPRVRAALASLKGALNGLKGSLAGAFAPILTAVAHALTTLINLLTQAVNAVGMFFAALTGQSYYNVAKGIGAIGSSASSASGSAKELKRQLAGFDELNILSAGSGGGGGGGGGGSSAGFAYEKTPIAVGIQNFVDQIKALVGAEDWDGLGGLFAEKINGAFDRARKLISWDNLGSKITQAVNALAGTFNGLVKKVKWEDIGTTFAEGVNTIVKAGNQILTKFNFPALAEGLTRGLNQFIQHVEWRDLGAFIARRAQTVVDSLIAALTTFKWGDAGTKFAEALNGFFSNEKLWRGAAFAINVAVKGLLDLTKNFIVTFDEIEAAKRIRDALGQIQWGEIASNFWETAKLAFKKAGNFLKVILGGDVYDVAGDAVEQMWKRGSGSASSATYAESIAHRLAQTIGTALGNIPWPSILEGAKKVFLEAFDGLLDGLFNSENGDIVLKIAGAIAGLKLAPVALKALLLKGLLGGGAGSGAGAAVAGAGSALPILGALGAVGFAGFKFANSATGKKIGDEFVQPLLEIAYATIKPGIENANEVLKSGEQINTGLGVLGDLVTLLQPKEVRDALNNGKGALLKIGSDFEKNGGDVEGWNKLYEDNTNALEANTKAEKKQTKAIAPSGVKPTHTIFQRPRINAGVEWDTSGWQDAFDGVQPNVTAFIDFLPKGAGGAGFLNKPLEWLTKVFAPGTDTKTRVELVKKIPGQTPDILFNTAKLLSVFAQLFQKPGTNGIVGIFGTALNVLATLFQKPGTNGVSGIYGTALSVFSSLFQKAGTNGVPGLYGTALSVFSSLFKKTGTNTVSGVYGTGLGVESTLTQKSGTNDVKGLYGTSLTVQATLVKKPGQKLTYTIGQNAANTSQIVIMGKGGSISTGGVAHWWSGVPKYAAGTARAHGTLFAAGEAGPEIVGHVNGRTEVLNQSQLASTMRSAVTSGMISALRGITFRMPAMATGGIMPYEVSAQIARSAADIQGTLDANNEDLIQTIINVAGQIVAAIQAQERRTGAGVGGMTAQQVINEINRRTQMFSASPLKGV